MNTHTHTLNQPNKQRRSCSSLLFGPRAKPRMKLLASKTETEAEDEMSGLETYATETKAKDEISGLETIETEAEAKAEDDISGLETETWLSETETEGFEAEDEISGLEAYKTDTHSKNNPTHSSYVSTHFEH